MESSEAPSSFALLVALPYERENLREEKRNGRHIADPGFNLPPVLDIFLLVELLGFEELMKL